MGHVSVNRAHRHTELPSQIDSPVGFAILKQGRDGVKTVGFPHILTKTCQYYIFKRKNLPQFGENAGLHPCTDLFTRGRVRYVNIRARSAARSFRAMNEELNHA